MCYTCGFEPQFFFVYRTLRKLLLHQTPNQMKAPLPETLMLSLRRYLHAAHKQAFSKAEENIAAALNKRKEEYDRKHQPKVLKVGTVVLLENTMQKQRKGGKLEPLWLGPYTIHRDLGKGLYELSNQAGTVLKKKANIARLKEYVKRAQDVSHLLYTFQSLNVRYMYISNNAIVLFTINGI